MGVWVCKQHCEVFQAIPRWILNGHATMHNHFLTTNSAHLRSEWVCKYRNTANNINLKYLSTWRNYIKYLDKYKLNITFWVLEQLVFEEKVSYKSQIFIEILVKKIILFACENCCEFKNIHFPFLAHFSPQKVQESRSLRTYKGITKNGKWN